MIIPPDTVIIALNNLTKMFMKIPEQQQKNLKKHFDFRRTKNKSMYQNRSAETHFFLHFEDEARFFQVTNLKIAFDRQLFCRFNSRAKKTDVLVVVNFYFLQSILKLDF